MSEKSKKSFFGNLFGGGSNAAQRDKSKKNTVAPESEFPESLSANSEASTAVFEPVELATAASEPVEASPEPIATSTEPAVKPFTTEDYSAELSRYEKHQKSYHSDKARYDRIVEEYENAKSAFTASLGDFSSLTKNMKDAKGIYQVDYAAYNKHKAAYDEARTTYEKTRDHRAALSEAFDALQKEITSRTATLTAAKASAQGLSQNYETQLKDFAKAEKEVDDRVATFESTQADLQETTVSYDAIAKQYEAGKPGYDRSKDRYDYATSIRNDYQSLKLQAEKMQAQEDTAKANYDEIQAVMDGSVDKMTISQQINDFSEKPLATIEGDYAAERKNFQDLEAKYSLIKARYDEETANFARIEKNYEELSQAKNVNRVALHYVTEEYHGAREQLSRADEEYRPIHREYSKQNEIHTALRKNYNAIKSMATEAQQNVDQAQITAENAEKTYKKVEEAYNYIATDNGILKQNLATKEAQYKEIEDEYTDIVAQFDIIKKDFEPIDQQYQETKTAYDQLTRQVFDARNAIQATRNRFELSQKRLSELTKELQEAKDQLETASKDAATAKTQSDETQKDISELSELMKTQLTTANERYVLTIDNYRKINQNYKNFASAHETYVTHYDVVNGDYGKIASLWRLADEEFFKINQGYADFEAHSERVVVLYKTVMEHYTEDKGYYDQVYSEYTKLQASQKNVIRKKQAFDAAAQNMKTLLVLDSRLTFPIYEATGQNYVDSYNLPQVEKTAAGRARLQNKPQLEAWQATYADLHKKLAEAATDFSAALLGHAAVYKSYRQVGGARLRAIDANEEAYTGIDVSRYMMLLEEQVASWEAEYKTREESFASLVLAYTDYLEREKQLMNLVIGNAKAQDSVQAVTNLINAAPDFVDMYSATYNDINALSDYFGVETAELTKPQPKEALIAFLHRNYYQRAIGLIKTNLSAFTGALDTLKADYEQALDSLQKSLAHFEISTGISTSQIQTEGVLNANVDLEKYLTTGVENNYEKLRRSVPGVSSVVNIIRKAAALDKVANRTINTAVDNTLVFPDKPINMSQALLDTEVSIYEPKTLPIPVKPAEPSEEMDTPARSSSLPEKPHFISKVEKPEIVEKLAK